MATTDTRVRRRYVRAKRKPRFEFNIATLRQLAKDLETQKIPLPDIRVADDVMTGLRAVIRDTGTISYHAQYEIEGSRPWIKLGEDPSMTIAQARDLTGTIRHLGEKGIDVQKGLHERLMRELKEKGIRWRP